MKEYVKDLLYDEKGQICFNLETRRVYLDEFKMYKGNLIHKEHESIYIMMIDYVHNKICVKSIYQKGYIMKTFYYEYKYKTGVKVCGHNLIEALIEDNIIILTCVDGISYCSILIDMKEMEYVKIEDMKE